LRTAADGAPVPVALAAVRKGGVVVCGGIHMSDIPSFPYARLWGERRLQSVANLTRADGREFLELAPRVPVRTRVSVYPLEQAHQALADLRAGRFTGAAVLRMESHPRPSYRRSRPASSPRSKPPASTPGRRAAGQTGVSRASSRSSLPARMPAR
jgi:hypothetical protein